MNFLKKFFSKKEDPIKSYEDFWEWFQKNEKLFFNSVKQRQNIEQDFFKPLSTKLNQIKDGFFYLTGMFDDNTVELVITADGVVKNIVFVEELVNSAPAIDRWKFTALKPALEIKDVSIEMASCKFNCENLSFYSKDSADYPDEIDIVVVHNDLIEGNKSTIINGTYIFLDNYLGESNFVTTIDNLTIIGKEQAEKELIPIEKLKDFLVWRQKEFIEKYEGVRHYTESDSYSVLEAELESGNPLLAVINTDLLDWENKASHPWILNVQVKYGKEQKNGMPDKETYKLLDEIENKITAQLKDYDGYLNIGRQTADFTREIYFACKDFKFPSSVLYNIQKSYSSNIELEYEIYKDKYWQSFNRFIKN